MFHVIQICLGELRERGELDHVNVNARLTCVDEKYFNKGSVVRFGIGKESASCLI